MNPERSLPSLLEIVFSLARRYTEHQKDKGPDIKMVILLTVLTSALIRLCWVVHVFMGQGTRGYWDVVGEYYGGLDLGSRLHPSECACCTFDFLLMRSLWREFSMGADLEFKCLSHL